MICVVTGRARSIRNNEQSGAIGAIGVATFIGCCIAAFGIWIDDGSPLGAVGWMVTGLAVLLAAVRSAQARVELSENEIRVVRVVKPQMRIPWSSIKAFHIRRYGPFPAVAHVELTDGVSIPIWGIQARNPPFNDDPQVARILKYLNSELEKHGA
jgi:hypothetical protein